MRDSGTEQDVGSIAGNIVPSREWGGLVGMASSLLQAQDLRTAMEAVVEGLESELEQAQVIILSPEGQSSGLHVLAGSANTCAADLDMRAVESLYRRTLANTGPIVINDFNPLRTQGFGRLAPGTGPFRWISAVIAGHTNPFGIIGLLCNRSRPSPDRDAAYLQASVTLLSAALARLHSTSQLISLSQQLSHSGIRCCLHILGDCIVNEVKQPVTAALMYMYACQNLDKHGGDADRPAISRFQGSIIRQLHRISGISEDFRHIMEDEGPDMEKVDLNSIIETTLMLLQADFDRININVERRLQPGLPKISLDSVMILQLFVTILRSCVEAMDFTIKKVITVTTEHPCPGHLEARISASAPGMEGRYFCDPDVPGSLQGMRNGLFGPAVCRYIIDAHNGGFRVSKNKGGGSVMHVTLPVNGQGNHI